MTGWKLTRRGDYINGDLADRTRAAVVALERSGLWSFVVRDRATGEDQGRGANYPTAQAAMDAAEVEAEAAPVEPNQALAAQVIDYMRAKQKREHGSGG
ncbi:MAG: hypothetical protein OXH93_06855 [Caldilineaceae bacterium]|nr:hypothetical protein [Caldilineaceae bacterium]